MSRHSRLFGALTAVVVGSLLLVGLGAPAMAQEYPSWDEVEDARQGEAATATAIAQIEGLLAGLESQAAELGRAAQVKAEAYNIARVERDAASARADRLQGQAEDAEERAGLSMRRAGQLLAQFARIGSGSVTLTLLLSPDTDDLLNRLGTMSRLTEQSTLIYRQATVDQRLSESLTEQARVAESERKTLARDAEDAFDEAQQASGAALALVEEQRAAAAQLYEQLASLKGTTADVERRYLEGLAQQPGDPGPGDPGPGDPGPGDPGPGDPGPGEPAPEPPNPSAVDGAIAFAYAQLGDWYEFGGYGPDTWDCSGLTKASYASVGIYIGAHGASSQYNYLANQGRLVPVGEAVPGDLLFYSDGGTTWGSKYHTTLYLGGGQMIEAQYEGVPVKVSTMRYYDLVPYAARPTG